VGGKPTSVYLYSFIENNHTFKIGKAIKIAFCTSDFEQSFHAGIAYLEIHIGYVLLFQNYFLENKLSFHFDRYKVYPNRLFYLYVRF